MALPRTPTPLFQETTESVRGRLLDALPDDLARVEGSWPRDFLEFGVLELTTLWDQLNRVIAEMFPDWASGERLDAWANSYGLERSEGTKATGVVRFDGAAGAMIGPDTLVSVPSTDPTAERAFFRTTNPTTLTIGAGLSLDLPVEALDVGTDFNVAPGAIVLLESFASGVEGLSNPLPTEGGTDPEQDQDLRTRVLREARFPTGAGTKLDYEIWSTEIPGVTEASVQALWDNSGAPAGSGNPAGSVAVSVRGPLHQPVSWQTLEQVQKHIDPSRALVALLEDGEPWALEKGGPAPVVSWNTTDRQVGASALSIGGGTTTQLAAPAAPTVAAATPGTPGLGAATYYYVITALSDWGETTISPQGSAAVTAGGRADLSWTPVADARGYRIYRSTVSGSGYLRVGEVTIDSFTDEGQATPSGAVPGANNADNPVTVGIDRAMDLSRFPYDGEMYVWVKSADWSKVTTNSRWRFETSPGNYYEFNTANISPAGTAKPVSGNAWWLFRVRKGQVLTTGAPDWSAIRRVEVIPFFTGGGTTLTIDYWRFISPGGAAGEGRAPIGAAVTVMTPVPRPINVAAVLTLAPGYTLTGATGTVNAGERIRSALSEFLMSVPPGEYVRVKHIENVIHDSPGVIDFNLTLPTGNVLIATTEYATLGTLTLT